MPCAMCGAVGLSIQFIALLCCCHCVWWVRSQNSLLMGWDCRYGQRVTCKPSNTADAGKVIFYGFQNPFTTVPKPATGFPDSAAAFATTNTWASSEGNIFLNTTVSDGGLSVAFTDEESFDSNGITIYRGLDFTVEWTSPAQAPHIIQFMVSGSPYRPHHAHPTLSSSLDLIRFAFENPRTKHAVSLKLSWGWIGVPNRPLTFDARPVSSLLQMTGNANSLCAAETGVTYPITCSRAGLPDGYTGEKCTDCDYGGRECTSSLNLASSCRRRVRRVIAASITVIQYSQLTLVLFLLFLPCSRRRVQCRFQQCSDDVVIDVLDAASTVPQR